MNDFFLKQTGYCHCCRLNVTFESHNSWLRDHFICTKCTSIPRQRAIQYVLDKFFSNYEKSKIHESSPSSNFISQYCKDYSFSQFFEDVPLSEKKNEIECQNLEKLTFDSNIFDIFITQDVMEHVFNPNLAFKEIIRVLKPGGIYIFTCPKHKGLKKSYPRAAKFKNSKIVFYCEPEYHGNPIGDGRSLVTWYYGDDFESLIFNWTNCFTATYIIRDLSLGIDGEFMDVFVIKKNRLKINNDYINPIFYIKRLVSKFLK